MAETPSQNSSPQPKKKPQRLTLPFLYATLGEQIVRQLGSERSYRHVFSKEISAKISGYHKGKLRFNTQDELMAAVITPVMEAFLEKACPAAKNKPQIVQWVCKKYLEHRYNGKPMKAENLHEIGENITYFDSLKASAVFKKTGAKSDLVQYKTYAAFEEMLEPYLERRAQREQLAQAFNLKPEDKAAFFAETTVLYDGKEGRVVVPHTSRASAYWGSNTKWCISGKYYAGLHFPRYNAQSPVIMILPKGQPANKIALTNHVFTSSANKILDVLPEPHQTLINICLQNLSEGARRGLAPWLIRKDAADEGKPALPTDRADALAILLRDSGMVKQAPRRLRKNREFITQLLGNSEDFPFQIRSKGGKVWQPKDAELKTYQLRALERLAEKGDMEKFIKYTHRTKGLWGNPDIILAADPAAVIEKIRTLKIDKPPLLLRSFYRFKQRFKPAPF